MMQMRFNCGIAGMFLMMTLVLPFAAQAEGLRFVVAGDSRGATQAESVNTAILGEINARMLAMTPRPSFVIFNGDMEFRSKGEGQWHMDDWLTAMKPVRDAGIALYPVVGNHELYQDKTHVLYRKSQAEYQKVFPFVPQNGPKGYEGLVYSFTSPGGEAFFAILDTYFLAPKQSTLSYKNAVSWITPAQIDWLREQTAASTAKFKFVAMHAPTFNLKQAKNPTCEDPGHCELWKFIDANHFAMSLASHIHLYSRKQIGPDVDPSYTNGVYQVIVGGGGAPLDKVSKMKAPQDAWNVVQAYNYMVVDIEGDMLTATAYGKDGADWKVIDQFTMHAQK